MRRLPGGGGRGAGGGQDIPTWCKGSAWPARHHLAATGLCARCRAPLRGGSGLSCSLPHVMLRLLPWACCRYWFLTEVYPLASGRHVVRTPAWLSRLCLQYGIGRVPIQAVNLANPSDAGFRAFSGRGRRLGD